MTTHSESHNCRLFLCSWIHIYSCLIANCKIDFSQRKIFWARIMFFSCLCLCLSLQKKACCWCQTPENNSLQQSPNQQGALLAACHTLCSLYSRGQAGTEEAAQRLTPNSKRAPLGQHKRRADAGHGSAGIQLQLCCELTVCPLWAPGSSVFNEAIGPHALQGLIKFRNQLLHEPRKKTSACHLWAVLLAFQ